MGRARGGPGGDAAGGAGRGVRGAGAGSGRAVGDRQRVGVRGGEKNFIFKKKKKRKKKIYINCIVGNKQTGGINNSKN